MIAVTGGAYIKKSWMFPAGEQGISVDVDIDTGSPLTVVWDYENDAELVKNCIVERCPGSRRSH